MDAKTKSSTMSVTHDRVDVVIEESALKREKYSTREAFRLSRTIQYTRIGPYGPFGRYCVPVVDLRLRLLIN